MKKKPEKKPLSVAQFIAIEVGVCGKTQREIAQAAGFENPNMITMLKQGHTRLPLDRVGPLAKALEVEPGELLRRVMREYSPDTWAALSGMLERMLLSEKEIAAVAMMRSAEPGEGLSPLSAGSSGMKGPK